MSAKPNGKKGNPVPVRFDGPDEKDLDDICEATGLGKSEVVRRAGRYAFPKFLKREVDILELIPRKNKRAVLA